MSFIIPILVKEKCGKADGTSPFVVARGRLLWEGFVYVYTCIVSLSLSATHRPAERPDDGWRLSAQNTRRDYRQFQLICGVQQVI